MAALLQETCINDVNIKQSLIGSFYIDPDTAKKIPLPRSIRLSRFVTAKDAHEPSRYDEGYIGAVNLVNEHGTHTLTYLTVEKRENGSAWLTFNGRVTFPPHCTVDIQVGDAMITDMRYYESSPGSFRVDDAWLQRMVPPLLVIRNIQPENNENASDLWYHNAIDNWNAEESTLTDIAVDKNKGSVMYKERLIVPDASVASLCFR
jgi:hypothetical protein